MMNFISVKNFNSYHSCSVAKPQDTIETTGNIQQTFDTPTISATRALDTEDFYSHLEALQLDELRGKRFQTVGY